MARTYNNAVEALRLTLSDVRKLGTEADPLLTNSLSRTGVIWLFRDHKVLYDLFLHSARHGRDVVVDEEGIEDDDRE